jgi:hypothetical protein
MQVNGSYNTSDYIGVIVAHSEGAHAGASTRHTVASTLRYEPGRQFPKYQVYIPRCHISKRISPSGWLVCGQALRLGGDAAYCGGTV